MDWIKRNLFFVIGASVAFLLMVGAGIYTWSGWRQNARALEEINGKYAELKRLINQNPNPGSGTLDNVRAAREQRQQVAGVIARVATRFEPIPAIPPGNNVTAEAFASALSTTIYRLQVESTNAGIILTPRYNFSFEQQSRAVRFAPGSVGPLAVQLGEVRAIMDVLIAAKINSLESLQRERVSNDDLAGQATDYLDQPSETNELAILSPYQITFRSFTPELAQVLCGFASSSRGIIVKNINVESSEAAWDAATAFGAVPTYAPTYAPVYTPPRQPYNPTIPPRPGRYAEESAFDRRYGVDRLPTPAPVPQVVYAQPTAPSGPRVLLDEKQLKITMLVQVVKLLPKP